MDLFATSPEHIKSEYATAERLMMMIAIELTHLNQASLLCYLLFTLKFIYLYARFKSKTVELQFDHSQTQAKKSKVNSMLPFK